jgi:hypothetical protein
VRGRVKGSGGVRVKVKERVKVMVVGADGKSAALSKGLD